MKKLSIFELFAAPFKVLRPFRLQPKRVSTFRLDKTGESKRVAVEPLKQGEFKEGVIHYGSKAAYLEPTPTKFKRLPLADPKTGAPLLNAQGEQVFAQFAVPTPWKRVTPLAVKPGQKRRAWLADQRVNT